MQPQRAGAQGAGQLHRRLQRPPAHGRGQLQGAERAVQAEADQDAPPPHPGAGDAVAAVVGAGPAQELPVAAARQPAPLGEHGRVVVDHAAEQLRAPPRQFGTLLDVVEHPVVLLEQVEVAAAGGAEDAALPALPVVHAHPVERGDRLRRHQHREGPGGVLVVARREPEAVVLDELPPIGLVPGHHQHPQQPRPVLQPERRRALLGERGGELVADRPAVPVRARVVVHQDVGLAGLLEPVGDRAQRVRGERVVAVQEDQVVAARLGHPRVPGPPEALVRGQVHGPYARVTGRVLVDDRPAGVR